MVTVFQTTIRQPYALQVQVDDKTVGYVANEEVFNSALEAVQKAYQLFRYRAGALYRGAYFIP